MAKSDSEIEAEGRKLADTILRGFAGPLERGAARCADCVYFKPGYAEAYKSPPLGECRRRAPVFVQLRLPESPTSTWPQVEPNDWCGEFAAKLTPQED